MALIFIDAKYRGTCAETKTVIRKGDNCLFNTATRTIYHRKSIIYKSELQRREDLETQRYIQANEDAYFDNFCLSNNI